MPPYRLGRTIGRKLDEGTLPGRRPSAMLREGGDGSACHVCDEPMDAAESKYEMRYLGFAHFMHPRCAMFWEVECRRRGSWSVRQ